MNQKGHLTKHQYLTLSEASGSPWPEKKAEINAGQRIAP